MRILKPDDLNSEFFDLDDFLGSVVAREGNDGGALLIRIDLEVRKISFVVDKFDEVFHGEKEGHEGSLCVFGRIDLA